MCVGDAGGTKMDIIFHYKCTSRQYKLPAHPTILVGNAKVGVAPCPYHDVGKALPPLKCEYRSKRLSVTTADHWVLGIHGQWRLPELASRRGPDGQRTHRGWQLEEVVVVKRGLQSWCPLETMTVRGRRSFLSEEPLMARAGPVIVG